MVYLKPILVAIWLIFLILTIAPANPAEPPVFKGQQTLKGVIECDAQTIEVWDIDVNRNGDPDFRLLTLGPKRQHIVAVLRFEPHINLAVEGWIKPLGGKTWEYFRSFNAMADAYPDPCMLVSGVQS